MIIIMIIIMQNDDAIESAGRENDNREIAIGPVGP